MGIPLRRILPTLLAALLLAPGCDDTTETPDPCLGRVAGDLVITEFMSDPPGTDSGQEYFELYNATSATIELSGLTLYLGRADGSSKPKTHVITAGSIPAKGYFVVGDAPEATKPAHVNYSYGTALGAMGNDSGVLGIKCGESTIDEVKYTSGPKSGHAKIFDGEDSPDSANNDVEANWCEARQELEAGKSFGSPGAANEACSAAATCVDPVTKQPRPLIPPAEGTLVITEFMTDPADVGDEAGEWVEIYAPYAADLNGVALWANSNKTVFSSTECLAMAAGSYAVLAKTADATKNDGLPEPLALFSVSLPNSNATLALKLGDSLIDEVTFATTVEGVASQLDPGKLDAAKNNDPSAFCLSTEEYGTVGANKQRGTPGEANLACPVAVDHTKCLDNGQERLTKFPIEGELVITEIMADPKGADGLKEYFEVAAKADVDLNGLEIASGKGTTVITSKDCLRVNAQSLAVIARSAAPYENGGIQGVKATFSFDLPAVGATLSLKREGAEVDSAPYVAAIEGAAWQLDSNKTDPVANNDPLAFCPSKTQYGVDGNLGSPGSANAACPEVVDPATCEENGAPRASVPPKVGELVITELMANPKGTDGYKEWFEVKAMAEFDLNGLVLSNNSSNKSLVAPRRCLHVKPGDYAIFSRSDVALENGGLPEVAGIFTFTLSASGSIVLRHGTDVIDYVLYANAIDGTAFQLDPTKIDPTVNDDPNAFCAATQTYGVEGNKGTPKAENTACAAAPDPTQCVDADTGLKRPLVLPVAGDVVVSEVMANPAKVDDGFGEYIELYMKTDVDLNGVEINSGGTSKVVLGSSACLKPGAGKHLLLAKNPDSAQNGGLPEVLATMPFSLSNSGGQVVVKLGAVEIDRATFPSAANGASTQLKPDKMDAVANDDGANWCTTPAGTTYGAGDLGTPGLANVACAP